MKWSVVVGLVLAVALVVFCSAADADVLLSATPPIMGGWSLASGQYLAQPFQLNAAVDLTSISLLVGDSRAAGQQFTVQLASTINDSGSTVIAQQDFVFSNSEIAEYTLPVGFLLPAGIYYVIAGHQGPFGYVADTATFAGTSLATFPSSFMNSQGYAWGSEIYGSYPQASWFRWYDSPTPSYLDISLYGDTGAHNSYPAAPPAIYLGLNHTHPSHGFPGPAIDVIAAPEPTTILLLMAALTAGLAGQWCRRRAERTN